MNPNTYYQCAHHIFLTYERGSICAQKKKSNRPANLLNLSIHLVFVRCLNRSCDKDKIRVFLFIIFSYIRHVVVFCLFQKIQMEAVTDAACMALLRCYYTSIATKLTYYWYTHLQVVSKVSFLDIPEEIQLCLYKTVNTYLLRDYRKIFLKQRNTL